MNLILISLDTTRADHLSCYGYPQLTSPHLDRFAAQGAVFTECFSTHIPTHPAHTCMLTGRDPFRTGIIAQGAQAELAEGVPMAAEILRENGYFTAAADNLGRWFSRGFDVYEGYQWEIVPGQSWRKAEGVNQAALRVLDQCASQDRPFFLFLHYWDCHTPYLPPPPFSRMFYSGDERDPENPSMDEVWDFEPFAHYFAEWMPGVTDVRFPIAQYDAEIAYLDSTLCHLFQRLDSLGLADDTCVVITADHGEEMDEHSCWFDHHGLYDNNLRVPLIVRCPGRIRPGQRLPGFVRTLDITPTLLELAGVENPEKMEGCSFLPMLEAPSGGALTGSPSIETPAPLARGTCDELFLTECTWMKKRGYRSHRYKYIQALEPDIHEKPPEELYDLLQDPFEQNNLALERPELAARFRQRLLDWKSQREEETGRPDPQELQAISLRRVGNPETPILRRPGAASG